MSLMVSSHAGLLCPTSQRCGSSSGFLPVGRTAAWANPKERWVLMCRGIFCENEHGWPLVRLSATNGVCKNRNNMKSKKQSWALTGSFRFSIMCALVSFLQQSAPNITLSCHLYSCQHKTQKHGYRGLLVLFML